LKEYPDVYVHTHLAENEDEAAQVARGFRWSRSCLDVYEHFEQARARDRRKQFPEILRDRGRFPRTDFLTKR
jgi:hypothetical protein